MSTNRIRHLLVAVIAVVAFSAIASSSAFAAEEFFTCQASATGHFEESKCEKEGTTKADEWLAITAAKKITGTSGNSKLEGTVAGLKLIIECKKDKTTGTTNEIETAGKNKGKILFEECGHPTEILRGNRKELTACTVANIEFSFLSQLIAGKGAGPELEFKPSPSTSTLFVTIKITGCALPEENKVEVAAVGDGITCALPEAEVGLVVHEIACASTGDANLRFAGKAASFTSVEKVEIENKERWLAR